MKLYNLFRITISLIIALAAVTASALDLSHYASESVLSQGHWVKISVAESGLYRIPASTLRKWGFSDPSKVRVHGYGGQRIDDALTAANYIDDLPAVNISVSADGSIVFYGVGPHKWDNGDVSTRQSNPYSTVGYYFLCESGAEIPAMGKTGQPGSNAQSCTFTERIQHEQDLVSPGEGGVMLVGEDFRYTPSRTFRFDLPDLNGRVNIMVSFVATTFGAPSRLSFTANGTPLESNSTDVIGASDASSEVYGTETRTVHNLGEISGPLELTISHSASTVVHNAWLNFIAVNYDRSLRMTDKALTFSTDTRELRLADASGWVRIWDVTDPLDIREVDYELEGNDALWTATQGGRRDYAAWADGSRLPEPTLVGTVANQNLHSAECPDMVIFTHPAWRSQAERIAELHRGAPDNLSVIVADAEEVYNEFSSGAPDVSGLRKYLKMLYDRGSAEGSPLRYVLLMGRMTYDERHLTAGVKSLGAPTLPAWQQRDEKLSLKAELGYATDDFLAMLEDDSGTRLGADKLSVAVGRMPVTSSASAKVMTDKIIDYARRPPAGAWKNRVMALADDLDGGVHYKQTEWFMNGIERQSDNPYLLEKVYLPAFEKSNGVYQSAREKMYRTLNDGVAWWTFIGHATNHSWTADGMLTYSDINNMYLRHLPFIYAATCNFLRWDSNTQSGGEILMNERNGGVIGMISATRPVYITYNGYFSYAMGAELSRRDSAGRLQRIGEIYRRAKNNIRAIDDNGSVGISVLNNENRLRYVLMGDPALRLATPDNLVAIESVNGVSVDGPDQIVIPARGMPVIKGVVTGPDGAVLSDFNGTLLLDLYDATKSTTLDDDDYEKMHPFDEHGEKLFSGSCRVVNGEFMLTVAMPSDITDNFREATIALYAYSDDSMVEASGIDRNCYVYGFDEEAAEDNESPVIELLAINHPTFRDGDQVNSDPMVIASISDNVGINLSMAGIGRQMSIMIDDKRSYNDVPYYFTPASDGSPAGTVAYPLEGLTEGDHTLRFRVFDTNGNSSTKTINFVVRDGLSPTVFDIYSDANPATTEANFYLAHNRPEGMLTVTVSVYNLLGHKLWEQTSTARSDMYISSPVTWDLTDGTGRRVPRGIYLYRATVTADGENYSTASRKIAVTSR